MSKSKAKQKKIKEKKEQNNLKIPQWTKVTRLFSSFPANNFMLLHTYRVIYINMYVAYISR